MSEWKDTEIGRLPKRWEIKTIGSLIEDSGISVGVMYPGEHVHDGVPIIKAGDIKEGRIIHPISNKISEKVNVQYKRTILKGGEILVVLVGDSGTTAVVGNEEIGYNVARAIGVLKLKQPEEAKFISYCFSFRTVKAMLDSFCNTTVQRTLNLKELKDVIIPWPNIEVRNFISKTLYDFDSKISLLRQQNETLEELAQTLFKRWFVDFEFPNENGQPYKSSGGKMIDSELGEIPEGWNLKTLDSVVNICNGYSYKGSELQESDVAMVTLKNFDRNGGFRFDGFKEIISDNYKDKHVVKDGDLVVAHTDLTQDAEVLGNPAIIMKNNKYRELIISMDLVKVESKNGQISTEFLYFLMADKRFKSHCKGYSNGTTVLHLSKNAIPEYQFAWPKNMSIVSEFGIHAKRTYSKIQNNISEIQNLTSLRDTLLPKLMSGDIEIKPD